MNASNAEKLFLEIEEINSRIAEFNLSVMEVGISAVFIYFYNSGL